MALSLWIAIFLSALLHSIKIEKALFWISFSLIVTLCLTTLVHLIQIGPLVFFQHNDLTGRLGGLFFFGETAQIAGITVLISFIAFNYKTNNIKKVIYVFFFFFSALAMIATDTRSAVFAALIGIIFSFFSSKSKINIKSKIFLLILTIISSYLVYYYISQVFTFATTNDDLKFRQIIWGLTAEAIYEKPIIGYGTETFIPNDLSILPIDQIIYADAHSAILGITISYGIIGAFLLLLFYVKIIKTFNEKSTKINKTFLSIPIYFVMAPFFWGVSYKIAGGFLEILIVIIMIGVIAHPELIIKDEKK